MKRVSSLLLAFLLSFSQISCGHTGLADFSANPHKIPQPSISLPGQNNSAANLSGVERVPFTTYSPAANTTSPAGVQTQKENRIIQTANSTETGVLTLVAIPDTQHYS